MKNSIKIIVLALLTNSVFAQKSTNIFKQNFTGKNKKVTILSGSSSLIIEASNGNEVIIESDKSDKEFPEEAEGLKLVTGGAVDNTGIGANVTVDGDNMKIKIPKSKYFGNFTVKIPKDISISVRENGNSYGKWQINGMKGEVEAETSYSTLNINNVSGPITARGGYGKLYIVYDQLNQSKPNTISASGAVDITIPADSKANLKIKATYAEVFTDFDIVQIPKKTKKDVDGNVKEDNTVIKIIEGDKISEAKAILKSSKNVKSYYSGPVENTTTHGFNMAKGDGKSYSYSYNYNSDDCDCDNSTNGTINGGGVELTIKSDHGNVYLRKKK